MRRKMKIPDYISSWQGAQFLAIIISFLSLAGTLLCTCSVMKWLTLLFQSISVTLGQHHGCWCPSALPYWVINSQTQIARCIGPTQGLPGADRTQAGSMLALWTLLSKEYWFSTINDEVFQLPSPSQCWEMIETTERYSRFLKQVQHTTMKRLNFMHTHLFLSDIDCDTFKFYDIIWFTKAK